MYNKEKKYDPDLDYSAIADELAKEGRWGEAYDKIYGITDSRTAKIRDTGYDYGRTNENVWQDLLNRYGGTEKQRYTSALEGMAADRYSPGANDSRYEAAIKAAMGMNYTDFARGADYRALADRYARAGQRAMDDTLGKVSARTGGLASSYAGSAAQQTYNDYMTQLEDAARSLYESRRNEAIKNAELARTAADRDYDRAIADRNYRTSVYNDLLGYAYKDEAAAADAAAAAAKAEAEAAKPRITAAQAYKAIIEDKQINDQTLAAYEYYFGPYVPGSAAGEEASEPNIVAVTDAQSVPAGFSVTNNQGQSDYDPEHPADYRTTWISINGHRYTPEEVDAMLKSGEIVANVNYDTGTVTYKKTTGQSAGSESPTSSGDIAADVTAPGDNNAATSGLTFEDVVDTLEIMKEDPDGIYDITSAINAAFADGIITERQRRELMDEYGGSSMRR